MAVRCRDVLRAGWFSLALSTIFALGTALGSAQNATPGPANPQVIPLVEEWCKPGFDAQQRGEELLEVSEYAQALQPLEAAVIALERCRGAELYKRIQSSGRVNLYGRADAFLSAEISMARFFLRTAFLGLHRFQEAADQSARAASDISHACRFSDELNSLEGSDLSLAIGLFTRYGELQERDKELIAESCKDFLARTR